MILGVGLVNRDYVMALAYRDFWFWQRANELLRQAKKIHRSFIQAARNLESEGGQRPNWTQPIDILEDGDTVWVISSMPGIAVHETQIRLESGELVICGNSLKQCIKN
jgi:HSP20 family molecular chaperone IbpA